MYALAEFVSHWAYPQGSAMLLWLLGIVLVARQWRRAGLIVLSLGLAWLWIWSMPVTSDWIRGTLEHQAERRELDGIAPADAAVVAGGAFSHVQPSPWPDLNGAADRYWHAARLYHADRVPEIIVTGGRSPGLRPGLTEAESGAAFLQALGVPESAIILEGRALSTRENAVYVAPILESRGHDDFLLVTSALHMPRALAAFRAVGLAPRPVATDFQVRPPRPGFRLRRWLPSVNSLEGSTTALHEYIGFWYYRLRGWA